MAYVVATMRTVTVSIKEVEKLGRLQCTPREAAAFFDIRVGQFKRLLEKDPEVRRAWERGQSLGCISIRRKQLRLGGSNANMAIFLGKQYLHQKDVVTNELTGDGANRLDASQLSQEERDALRRLLSRRAESGESAG